MATGRTKWAMIAVGLVLLAGCARPIAGSAQPNQEAADAAMAKAYDRGLTAFTEHFEKIKDEKGHSYYYARFAGKTLNREVDNLMLGSPPAVLSRVKGTEDGDEFDKFHPGGSDQDYVKLGPKLAKLAPTPWVSMPTLFPKDGFFTPCMLDGISSACGLSSALGQTKLESPEGLVKEARTTEDGGLEVRTGVTLDSFLEYKVMIFGDAVKKNITPEMLKAVIPVTITINREGEFSKFELRTSIPGEPSALELQLGYEANGKSARKDFPKVPQSGEVTAITDKAAQDKFWDDVYAIQGK